jgi:hypothetical protein
MGDLRGAVGTGNWEWLRFAASLPAKPVQFIAQSTNRELFSGRCIVREITGLNNGVAGGTLTLNDGGDASGTLVLTQGYAASASFSHSIAAFGALCEIGLFLVTGGQSLTGNVLLVPLWEYNITPPGD